MVRPPHLGGAHHQHNQGRHPHHHHKALDKVGLQGGHIAPQYQHQGRGDGNDDHAGLLINVQNHRAHAGQPLVHRGGVGDEEQEDHHRGKQPHPRALETLLKQLGHGFDVVAAGQVPGAVGQHQPGQQRAEHRVAQAHQAAPQAVVPAGAAGIADEHHRRKVRRTVREGRDPGPGAASAYGKARHVCAFAGIPNADPQHKQGVYPNDYPNGHFLAQCCHIL